MIHTRARDILQKNSINYPPLKIGSSVRIHKRTFGEWRKETKLKKKIYQTQWTYEIYKVASIGSIKKYKNPWYELVDEDGKLISRKFLRQDLLLIDRKKLEKELEPGEYKVEKIVGKRGNLYEVKWEGYSKSSWIKASDFTSPETFKKLLAQYKIRS